MKNFFKLTLISILSFAVISSNAFAKQHGKKHHHKHHKQKHVEKSKKIEGKSNSQNPEQMN